MLRILHGQEDVDQNTIPKVFNYYYRGEQEVEKESVDVVKEFKAA